MIDEKILEQQKHRKMMESGQGLAVSITQVYEAKTSEGTIRLQFWSQKERWLRALKFGGICWALALLTVFVPIAHFVLVPSFFICGPVIVFFLLNQNSVILGGEGTCPHCNKVFPIVRTAHRFPFTDVCTHCRSDVSINPISK